MHLPQNSLIALDYGLLSLQVLWASYRWRVEDRLARAIGFWLPAAFVASCSVGHLLVALGQMETAGWWHWVTVVISTGQVLAVHWFRKELGARFSAPRETEAILHFVQSDPWGVWEVGVNSEGKPDLLCIRQNAAAAAETGEMVGRYLCEVMPGHSTAEYTVDPLIDSYLAVAQGQKDTYKAEVRYRGQAADGRYLDDWYRQQVVQVGPNRVFITWRNITQEHTEWQSQTQEHTEWQSQQELLAAQKALLSHEMVLWYQPIYRLNDMSLSGFEALIRWPQPDGSVLSPADFLPLLDRAGLATEVFFYTVKLALDALQQLPENLRVGVNLAPSVIQAESFPERMYALCRLYRVSRERLLLEITEQDILALPLLPKLEDTRQHGHPVAMDDFGTGYSNLGALTTLPIDIVKFGLSMVRGVDLDNRRAEVLSRTIALARVLELATVAEGLEQQGEIELVTALGCNYGQGFGLGKPMPLDEALRLAA